MAEPPPTPPPKVLEWLAKERGTNAPAITAIAALPQNRGAGPWMVDAGPERFVLHLGHELDALERRQFATEAAALELLAPHGLAVPTLIAADLDGSRAGCLALVQRALPGSSLIPVDPPAGRARAFGRSMAAFHAVALDPTDALPRRDRSLDGVGFDDLPIPPDAVEMFAAIREAMAAPPELPEPTTLVHGDLWQGNTLWSGPDDHAGTIDWDFAGVGHPGIDLGTTRLDVAMAFGTDQADELLAGWLEASGAPSADAQWYFDLLAVVCTPPDITPWVQSYRGQGRADIDAATMRARRAAFVEEALRKSTGK